MIFVTIGSYEPFDRLLNAVADLPGDELVVAQCGTSKTRPTRATCVEFLPFQELTEHLRAARAVVTHAGVGSVLSALTNGKRPIVVPRMRRLGEAVDDHQLTFARRLHVAGAVLLVEDTALLADAVAQTLEAAPLQPAGGPLAAELRTYLAGAVSGR